MSPVAVQAMEEMTTMPPDSNSTLMEADNKPRTVSKQGHALDAVGRIVTEEMTTMPPDSNSTLEKTANKSRTVSKQGHALDAVGRIVTEDGLTRMMAAAPSYSSLVHNGSHGYHTPSLWRNPGDHHDRQHHHYEVHTAESLQTTTTGMLKHPYAGGFDPALKQGRAREPLRKADLHVRGGHARNSPRVKTSLNIGTYTPKHQPALTQVRLVDSADYSSLELHAHTQCHL